MELEQLSVSLNQKINLDDTKKEIVASNMLKGSMVSFFGIFILLFFRNVLYMTFFEPNLVAGILTGTIFGNSAFNVQSTYSLPILFIFVALFFGFLGLRYYSRAFGVSMNRNWKSNMLSIYGLGSTILIIAILLMIIWAVHGGYNLNYVLLSWMLGLVGIALIALANVYLAINFMKFGKVSGAPILGMISILFVVPFVDLVPPVLGFCYGYLLKYNFLEK